ncbi:MAG: autotransporter domain-containing protein [Puniceicoccales bacterium]|jgi:hypothetical protein|nr:autotransporter domain-containing protein [Puniceicoccales bacterium]
MGRSWLFHSLFLAGWLPLLFFASAAGENIEKISELSGARTFSPNKETTFLFCRGGSVVADGRGLSPTRSGSGGTLALETQDRSAGTYISAVANGGECAAIDLGGLSNFSVKFKDSGVLRARSTGGYSVAVGIPYLVRDGQSPRQCDLSLEYSGCGTRFFAAAEGSGQDVGAAVFGFGGLQFGPAPEEDSSSGSDDFSSSGASSSEAFEEPFTGVARPGAGVGVRNVGSEWSFERMKGSTACSLAKSDRSSRATVFGVGDLRAYGPSGSSERRVLCDWTGKFWGDNVLAAIAIGGSGSAATVFGVPTFEGYDFEFLNGKIACNWTMDFQGKETIAAVGCGPNLRLSALGGFRNGSEGETDGMRFYFHGAEPSVLAALRLESPPSLEESRLSLSLKGENFLPGEEASWPRALALGPNFQLNVGRRPLFLNERETGGSVRGGGQSSGDGSGTLSILGAVARAPAAQAASGATLRIDSGWTVNCFGPVQDLDRVEIFNGRLVLNCGSESATKPALERAMAQLRPVAMACANFDDPAAAPLGSFRFAPSAGTFSYDSYVPKGQLIIGNGQRLLFHLDCSAYDLGDFPFRRSGRVECVGTAGGNGWITFREGAQLAFQEDSALQLLGQTPADYVLPVGFLVLRAEGGKRPLDVFGRLQLTSEPIVGAAGCHRLHFDEGQLAVQLRRPGGGGGFLSLAEVSGVDLIWCNYPDFSGLAICDEAFPFFLEAYREVFSIGEELDQRLKELQEKIRRMKSHKAKLQEYVQALALEGALPCQSQTLATVRDLSEVGQTVDFLSESVQIVQGELAVAQDELTAAREALADIRAALASHEHVESDILGLQQSFAALEADLGNSCENLEEAIRKIDTQLGQMSDIYVSREDLDDFFSLFLWDYYGLLDVVGEEQGSSDPQPPVGVFASGILAQAKVELLEMCNRTALQHVSDVTGNGLFGGVFGGTVRRGAEKSNEFQRKDRIFGAIVGDGYVTDFVTGQVRYGVVLGYGCDDVSVEGPESEGSKNIFRQEYVISLEAIYRHDGNSKLPAEFQFLGGCGCGINNPYQGADKRKKSPIRYHDLGLYGLFGCSKAIFRAGSFRLGPWGEVRGDFVEQRSHLEAGGGSSVQISKTRHEFATCRAGLKFAIEPSIPSDQAFRTHGNLGWEWQPLQRCVAVRTEGKSVSLPSVAYHRRSALSGTFGVRTKIGSQWEFCAELTGSHSRHQLSGTANFSMNCLF